jgi:hypothetical protein
MMEDVTEIVILDEDEFEDEYRNAARDHRSRRRSAPPPRRINGRGSRAIVTTRPRSRRRANAGAIVRPDTGSLSTGTLVEAGSQILAAMQPLPIAPVATGELVTDMENLMLYQRALAEHAKRDEQLRTVGSLASKLFA